MVKPDGRVEAKGYVWVVVLHGDDAFLYDSDEVFGVPGDHEEEG